MSDKLYNFLKYFVAIVMPALLGLFKIVAGECDLNLIPIFSTNLADFITNIWVGVEAFLGIVFGVSNAVYYARRVNGKMVVEEDEVNE